jgi:carbon monoxide dehydrogenase subunit G
MHLVGQRRLPVDRERAWAALLDPAILRAAIPGCESIEESGDGEYVVLMTSALGPVKAKFRGRLKLENVVPPESYTLRFEGEGAAAGFAKGAADVTLTGEGKQTLLDYRAEAQVGGRLAQLGSRLIDPAAHKLVDEFFAAFESLVR